MILRLTTLTAVGGTGGDARRLAGDALARLRLVGHHARVALPLAGRTLEHRRQRRLRRRR